MTSGHYEVNKGNGWEKVDTLVMLVVAAQAPSLSRSGERCVRTAALAAMIEGEEIHDDNTGFTYRWMPDDNSAPLVSVVFPTMTPGQEQRAAEKAKRDTAPVADPWQDWREQMFQPISTTK